MPLPKSPRVAPLRPPPFPAAEAADPPPTPTARPTPTITTTPRSRLWNRIVLVILAMALLWGTSLNTAVFFMEYFVRIPAATFPIKVCQTAAREIQGQATTYRQCAARQLARCDVDLDDAAAKERARAQWAQQQNVARLNEAEALVGNCGSAVLAAQAALTAWIKLSSPFAEVPYVADPGQCPADARLRTQALLGDSSGRKTQVMASSAQYSKESKNTVARLAEYTVALNDYNAAYLANKTQGLRLNALDLVTGINGLNLGSMNASFADLRRSAATLMACVAPAAPDPTTPCTALARSARRRLEDMVADMQALFQDAAAGFQAYKDNWYEVAAQSQAAYAAFSKFYEDVVDGIQKAGLSTSDFGNTFSIDWADFFVNPGELLDGVGIVTGVPPVPTLDAVWTGVVPALDLFVRNLTLASLQTNLRALKWAVALETSLQAWDVLPDDYNPPAYVGSDGTATSVQAEAEAHNALADSFVARTATSLDAFDSYNDYVGSQAPTNVSRTNVTTLVDRLPRFDFSFNLKYETLAAPDFDLDAVLRIFDRLPSLALATDTIYRVYSSLHILWRFRHQATAVKLPTVDFRPDRLLLRRMSTCWATLQLLHPRRLLAWVLASRYLPYLLLSAVLFPVLTYLIALYVAAYYDYQKGCVFRNLSLAQPRYSFVTRTLNSLAFNAAAFQGNQAMYDGLKTYNQRRAQYCADYGKAAQTTQLNAERYLETLQGAQQESLGNVQLLAACLDVPALDAGFEAGCCGEAYRNVTAAPFDSVSPPFQYPSCGGGGPNTSCPVNTNYDPSRPYPPLSVSLGTASCAPMDTTSNSSSRSSGASSPWALEDGVFHCEVLPSCTPTCSGPHPELLQAWSRHCACSSEWAIHAHVLAGSLAVLTYILLNVARKFLLRGLGQTHWRLLSDDKLTLLGHCDAQGCVYVGPAQRRRNGGDGEVKASTENTIFATVGRPTTPKGGEEEEDDDDAQQRQALVQAKVETALRFYEAQGWVLVILAVALFVGCGVLLTKAPQFLDYQP